jgi:CheY-like chemotaxis protein
VSGSNALGVADEVTGEQRLSGIRLLVVDDSRLNQIVTTQILEREGARVETAAHGLAAVSCVQTAPTAFDAVLMDIQMPELDGIEATRRIRAIAGCAGLPILAMTAGALAIERQRAFAAGVNVVLAKPFDPEVIVASVREHVKRVRRPSTQTPRLDGLPLDWPMIDGIDARDVQRRLGGDAQLFCSLLRMFVAEPDALDDLARTLAMTPSGAAITQAAQRMHKLRGAAGNLGARDLYAAASETEQALRAEWLPVAIEGLCRVVAELARIHRSAAAFLEAPAPLATTAAIAPPIDPVALAALVQYLGDHDMEASNVFAALSQALAQALGGAEHARMRGLLDRLEFDAALEIVRPLIPCEPAATPGPPT